MKLSSRIAVVMLTVAPSLLMAQRGGMGGMGGMGRGGMGGSRGGRGERGGGDKAAAPAIPSSDDILKDSPLRLLIDKKKELSLTDSQRMSLVTQQGALDMRLQPLLVALDSARANRPRAALSDSARASGADPREAALAGFRALHQTLTSIRAVEDSAATGAVNAMNDKQRAKAYKLLAERRDKIDKRETPQRGPRIEPPTI